MKKVALFSDGWKRLITYAWVDGMMKFISKSDEEICLYQYNCHGNWSRDEKHNHGEYNIIRCLICQGLTVSLWTAPIFRTGIILTGWWT